MDCNERLPEAQESSVSVSVSEAFDLKLNMGAGGGGNYWNGETGIWGEGNVWTSKGKQGVTRGSHKMLYPKRVDTPGLPRKTIPFGFRV